MAYNYNIPLFILYTGLLALEIPATQVFVTGAAQTASWVAESTEPLRAPSGLYAHQIRHTCKSFSFSFDLIHVLPWVWGSMSRGYLVAFVTIMPFWIDKSSPGSPCRPHSPIWRGGNGGGLREQECDGWSLRAYNVKWKSFKHVFPCGVGKEPNQPVNMSQVMLIKFRIRKQILIFSIYSFSLSMYVCVYGWVGGWFCTHKSTACRYRKRELFSPDLEIQGLIASPCEY